MKSSSDGMVSSDLRLLSGDAGGLGGSVVQVFVSQAMTSDALMARYDIIWGVTGLLMKCSRAASWKVFDVDMMNYQIDLFDLRYENDGEPGIK